MTFRRSNRDYGYSPWTAAQERTLAEQCRAGTPVLEIARILRRGPGAIRSRLKKLGLEPAPAPRAATGLRAEVTALREEVAELRALVARQVGEALRQAI